MATDDSFFDRSLETISFPNLYDSYIVPKLHDQIGYVMQHSPFYREKFRNASPEELCGNFETIPFTEKNEVLSDQSVFPPFGSNLCVDRSLISRVHRTSGTTARPIFIGLTAKDIETTVRAGGRCFWSAGLRPGDTVVHCLNYCLWMGGFTDHQSLEATGATVVPYGVGNTVNLIQTILDMGIDTIHCTPSYLIRIEELLKSEYNLEPKDLGLKKGLFGGESGIQNRQFRKRIEKKWGMVVMNANYGLSDVLSMFGAECSQQQGLHFHGQDAVYPEVIDPDTGTVLPLQDGTCGELVLTNLVKEALPLIRFRTHDIIEILGTECACKRTGFRFRLLGRSDDMLVVKGINVFPQAIGDIINDYLDVFNGEFRITAPRKEPIDSIMIEAEIRGNPDKAELRRLRALLKEQIHQRLSISPEIHLIRDGLLPRTAGKTKRLIRV
jgi:phenylacetate-CoA ligase